MAMNRCQNVIKSLYCLSAINKTEKDTVKQLKGRQCAGWEESSLVLPVCSVDLSESTAVAGVCVCYALSSLLKKKETN